MKNDHLYFYVPLKFIDSKLKTAEEKSREIRLRIVKTKLQHLGKNSQKHGYVMDTSVIS